MDKGEGVNDRNAETHVSKNSMFLVVGLLGFEPKSRGPKPRSLDQASRQPLIPVLVLLAFVSFYIRFDRESG